MAPPLLPQNEQRGSGLCEDFRVSQNTTGLSMLPFNQKELPQTGDLLLGSDRCPFKTSRATVCDRQVVARDERLGR